LPIGSILGAVAAQVGFANVRLRELRNDSAQKWRMGCHLDVFQDAHDPTFSSAPVFGSDVREDCTQIRPSALRPPYCQAIGPNSSSNDFAGGGDGRFWASHDELHRQIWPIPG
jgi:hypothetical protein